MNVKKPWKLIQPGRHYCGPPTFVNVLVFKKIHGLLLMPLVKLDPYMPHLLPSKVYLKESNFVVLATNGTMCFVFVCFSQGMHQGVLNNLLNQIDGNDIDKSVAVCNF